jgi:dihydroorotate dehydrogenase (NAD+) catalytic subunit
MRDLTAQVGALRLANPVMPASGCFGPELAAVTDVSVLGATVTKTQFLGRRPGNPTPRLAEVPAGMLNSVGIPSRGTQHFRDVTWPSYGGLGPPVIVSLGGLTVGDFWLVAEELADLDAAAFEVNVSCPNLEEGGLDLGTDPDRVEEIVRGVVARVGDRPVLAKLTPNVTSIVAIARGAARGGAAAVTVANTFLGLALDIHTRRPKLGHGYGGVSGPAVRPMVVRMVHQVATALDVPVVACGGVGSAADVVEYLMAGAVAVQVGTATFTRPSALTEIVADLPAMLDGLGVERLADLTPVAVPAP